MNTNQFEEIFVAFSSEVADEFYPKNELVMDPKAPCLRLRDENGDWVKTERSKRRGEFMRDQGIIHARLSRELVERGILEESP